MTYRNVPNFARARSNDLSFNRLESSFVNFAQKLSKTPILNGLLIEDVSITTAQTEIQHNLGRDLVGWIVVDKDTDGRVWRVDSGNANVLKLDCSADMIISLWVF